VVCAFVKPIITPQLQTLVNAVQHRNGRSLDDLVFERRHRLTDKKANFILDADVRSFFDEVSQSWLIRFVEHRIADPRIIRLIQKWLQAGVLEDGVVTVSEKGTGQGSVISPPLANVFSNFSGVNAD
jgi:RNA-directed DNA polymerase